MHRSTALGRLVVLLAGATAPFAPAQGDEKIVGLGEFLFSSTALSAGRTVSCVTCHDPAKSLADGRPEAVGLLKIAIGRNSPTLTAIGAIARFRDPRQPQSARPGSTPKTLSLEDRCLEPLENELEMAASADVLVASLRKDAEMSKKFNEAFGDQSGVSKVRLGKALGAFVRTLDTKAIPYADHLAGKTSSLSDAQLRGEQVFKSRGCADCHSGPALSDGMMHIVDPPWGQRMLDRQRTASERRIELLRREYAKHKTADDVARMSVEAVAREARLRANTLPGGGGYDPDQIEVQTATLWNVANTPPYFRDGSVKSLDEAVRTHLREMRAVRDAEPRVKEKLAELARAGKRSPTALRAKAFGAATRLDDLAAADLSDLMEFLNALSSGGNPDNRSR